MEEMKTLCLDLDGVLADYSQGWQGVENIGDPIPGAVDFTERLARNFRVVIYTTRCCENAPERFGRTAADLEKIVRDWLDRHDFQYASVWTGQGKPFYAAVIDDRAVNCQPQQFGPEAFRIAFDDACELAGVLPVA